MKATTKAKAKAKEKDKKAGEGGGAAPPEVAKQKSEVRAALKSDAKAGQIAVGSAQAPAEKEADALAKTALAKEPKAEEEGPPGGGGRDPPVAALVTGSAPLVRRVSDDQPSTDELTAVPPLDGKLADVSVSQDEEVEFEETTGNDWSTMDSAGAIRMRRDGAPAAAFRAPRHVAAHIRSARGGPMPGGMRRDFERRFGARLDHARVHVDPRITRTLKARAFAYRGGIWLRSAADLGNRDLMAHETVHVLQQTQIRPLPPARHLLPRHREGPTVRRDYEPDNGVLERQAERVADRFDGYGVIKMIAGRRLFTGVSVDNSAVPFVGAVMTFIGQGETFDQMKQSGSLEDGFRYMKEQQERYDISWDRVRRTFSQAWDDFELTAPIESLERSFGQFFRDLFRFTAAILGKIAELIAEALVISFGPAGREVWEKIKMVGDVLWDIVQAPLEFAKNMIRAIVQGTVLFGQHIWEHIKKGFLAWILGPFAQMGITLPDKLDLKGIMSIILQVLGLTYGQLRPRIVRKLNPRGELKVGVVEKMIEVVQLIRDEGIVGVWRKIMEYVQNLQSAAIEAIKGWAIRAIVQAGLGLLAKWTNPAGALIGILKAIYNLIMFFIERKDQILAFADSVFQSIAKIARGQLSEAAQKVEDSLAKTIPIIIAFLAKLIDIPDVVGAVRGFITKIRDKVHRAFDKMLDWVVSKVKKLFARLVSRFKRQSGDPEDALVLQGKSHTMTLEAGQGPQRRLMIASEPTKMTADYLESQLAILDAVCTEPITTELGPKLRNCVTKLRALEREERTLSGKSSPNRDGPTIDVERKAVLAEIKTLLQEGTLKSVLSKEEQDSGEVEADQLAADHIVSGTDVREDQKDQVKLDANAPRFRFVILNDKAEGEGFAGPWKVAGAVREQVKAKLAESGSDARYLIELDHNPEHQIMWRLAFLETDPIEEREGEGAKEPEPMFPGLAAQYGGNPKSETECERDRGHGAMALATRREVNTSEINKQAGAVSEFKQATVWDDKRQRFRIRPDLEAWPAFAPMVLDAANQHHTALTENYQKFLAEKDSDESTVDAVRRNGPQIIGVTQGYLSGMTMTGPTLGGGGGSYSGVGMRADPVEAELITGPYADAKAKKGELSPQFGAALQTHHMIEQSVLGKLQESATGLTIGAVVKEPGAIEGFAPSVDPIASLTAALQGKTGEDGTPVDAGAEFGAISNQSGLNAISVFPQGKDIKNQGFAVNVLSQVNQLAGSQQPDEAVGRVEAAARSAADTYLDRIDAAIGVQYGAFGDTVGAADLKAARKAIRGEMTEYLHQGGAADAVKAGLTEAVELAGGRVFDRFSELQAASMTKITPNDPGHPEYNPSPGVEMPSPRMVYVGLRQRQTALTREKVIAENRAIWAA